MCYFSNNVLALLPCAIKIPLEAKIAGFIKENNIPLKYEILSNAVVQEDVFDSIKAIDDIANLPDMMIAPGFNRFFYPSFVERFVKKGFFKSALDFEAADAYKEAGVIDPNGYYDIVAVNPLVFLADKSNYPDLEPPKKWEDILSPHYEKKIAFRGHNADSLCEGVLFETYNSHGIAGIKKLARNIKCRLHPSQMVSLAGSRKKESPFVSVLPLSFANLVKENNNVQIIWPEDGAVMNPVVMLTKKDCSDDIKSIAKYFLGSHVGELFSEIGFYSLRRDMENKMPHCGKYKWIGWDFLFSNNLETLHDELNQIVNMYSLEEKK